MLHTEVAERLEAPRSGTLTYNPDRGDGNIFIGHMPDKPNSAVAVMAPGGPSPEDEHLGYDMVRVQLIVRGTTDPYGRMGTSRSLPAGPGWPSRYSAPRWHADTTYCFFGFGPGGHRTRRSRKVSSTP